MNKILVEVSVGELLDKISILEIKKEKIKDCLLYTSPSPRDNKASRMPSSA